VYLNRLTACKGWAGVYARPTASRLSALHAADILLASVHPHDDYMLLPPIIINTPLSSVPERCHAYSAGLKQGGKSTRVIQAAACALTVPEEKEGGC
jgi:hypothetical protein